MARVPYLQQSDLPPEHQELLARPIALNRAMANSPNASRAMSTLAMYIRHKSKLDPQAARDGDPAGRLPGEVAL